MLHNNLPEAMRPHMRRVALAVPVPIGESVITEVWLRQPTARYLGEREAMFGDGVVPAEADYAAVALATGLTREQVLEIDIEDYARISEAVGDFFAQRASTSTTPGNGAQSLPIAPQS